MPICRLYLWIFFLLSGTLSAQAITALKKEKAHQFAASGHSIDVGFADNSLLGTSQTWNDRQVMGAISVGFDPSDHFCHSQYLSITIPLQIDWEEWDPITQQLIPYSDQKTFTVDFDPFNRKVYNEQAIFYIPGAYWVQATLGDITSVTALDSLGTAISLTQWKDLPFDFYIEVKTNAERYPIFHPTHIDGFSISQVNQNILFQIIPNPSQPSGAAAYDIEYTWVDNYDPQALSASSTLGTSQIFADFTFNSTRVRLAYGQSSFSLPMVFDRGYVVFRYRAVGRDPSDWEYEFLGNWNDDPGYGNLLSVHLAQAKFYINPTAQHEPGKNWQAQISFAEEGKNKHVVAYADGTSRVRQQVTLLSSEQVALAAQTIYDHQGRQAVSILPAPTGSDVIQYYPNFNRADGTSQIYNKQHFDLDGTLTGTCLPNPPVGLDPSSGAGRYYSPSNPNQSHWNAFIADAQKYPFTLVQYTPDQTGRVRSQGGVGPNHQIGSGHETQYFYGKPFQEQLDMLFGSDVGYDVFYKKQMVVDPNGQVSVSYLDMDGQVIATSLAGDLPNNLDPLLSEDQSTVVANDAAIPLSIDLLNVSPNNPLGHNNALDLQQGTLTLFSQFLVTHPQTYSFDYQLLGLDYLDSCLKNLCMDCIYDVEIDIMRMCDGTQDPAGHFRATLGGLPDTLCADNDTLNHQWNMYLEMGSYQVAKKVTLNQQAILAYSALYLERDTCLKTINDFFQAPDTTDCFYTCEVCEAELAAMGTMNQFITQKTNELATAGVDVSSNQNFYTDQFKAMYLDKQAQCAQLCQPPSLDLCATAYSAMLMDMSPGGQYGFVKFDSSGVFIATDKTSVFVLQNQLPYRTNAQLAPQTFYTGSNPPAPHWRNPMVKIAGNWTSAYIDASGQPFEVTLTEISPGFYSPAVLQANQVSYNPSTGLYTTPLQNLLKVEDFLALWQPSFAQSLVIYHPEYLMYDWCESNTYGQVTIAGKQLNTWQYDALLDSYSKTQAQTQLGILMDPSSIDPFYQTKGGDPFIAGFAPITTNQQYIDHLLRFSPNFTGPISTSQLTLWESAWITQQLGGAYSYSVPALATALPTGYFENSGAPLTDRTSLISSEAIWKQFASQYMGAKQSHLSALWHHHTISRGLNTQCIGTTNTYGGASAQTSLCDPAKAHLFEQKSPRFPSPSQAYQAMGIDNAPPDPADLQTYAAQSYLAQTGHCIIASQIQGMINTLAQQGNLTQTTTLYPAPILGEELYNELAQTLNPNSMVWNPVISSTAKHLSWNTASSCDFVLSIASNAPGWVDFTNLSFVLSIDNVNNVSGTHWFDLTALFTHSSGQTWQGKVNGQTCLDLTACKNQPPVAFCRTTPAAKELFNLLETLRHQGHIFSSSPVTLDPVATSSLSDHIMALLGGNGTFTWQYVSATQDYFLLKNTTTAREFQIELSQTQGDWIGGFKGSTPMNTLNFAQLKLRPSQSTHVTTAPPYPAQQVIWDLAAPSNLFPFLSSITPNHNIYLNVSNNFFVTTPFTICETLPDLSGPCVSDPHKAYDELQALLQNLDLHNAAIDTLDSVGQCLTQLQFTTGQPASFSSGITFLNLWPDLSLSLDQMSSNAFFASVSLPNGSIDTLKGMFCKPIQACDSCVTTGCEVVDSLEFEFTFPSASFQGDYDIAFPNSPCLSIAGSRYQPTDTLFNDWEFAQAFAQQINDSNSYVHAFEQNGNLIIRMPANLLQGPCQCTPGSLYFATLLAHPPAPGSIRLSAQASCCKPKAPAQPCPPEDSLVMVFNLLPATPSAPTDTIYFSPLIHSYCSVLSDMKFIAGTTQPQLILSTLVDSINQKAQFYQPPLIHADTTPTGQLQITLFPDALLPGCWCDSRVPVSLAFIHQGNHYTMSDSVAIDCCVPPLVPVVGPCDLAIQQLIEARDSLQQILHHQWDIQYNVILQGCQGKPSADSTCMALLDSLSLWQNDTLMQLNSWFQTQYHLLLDTCDYWYQADSLTFSSPCDPQYVVMPNIPYEDDCVDQLMDIAWFNAKAQYEAYRDSVQKEFIRRYTAHCMGVMETFTMDYQDKEYHFTLYYFDQAQNLIKTVPPRATTRLPVAALTSVKAARDGWAPHTVPNHHDPSQSVFQLCTHYQFNSLDQPIKQNTPDAGFSQFWYDELGRIVASQNAKQAAMGTPTYSYSLYDALGRVIQVGECNHNTVLTQSIAGETSSRNTWMAGTTNHQQVTETLYDQPWIANTQQNLRNRVSAMIYKDLLVAPPSAVTYYSYDIHGNVSQLWQYNRTMEQLAGTGQGTKTMYYYYDLISGNVKSVAYNPDGEDRMFHRYSYDADNRITRTHTWNGPGMPWSQIGWSNTGTATIQWQKTTNPIQGLTLWPWEEDARYFYYTHGPLARTELGELKVQGLDYIYTIQGWIKAVNPNNLEAPNDPGKDGDDGFSPNSNQFVARDAMSYMLDYFSTDYQPIGGTSANTFQATKNPSGYGGSFLSLYNGNISAMTTTLRDLHTLHALPQGAQYRYDQLNRISAMDVWQDLDISANAWDVSAPLLDYQTRYHYDANGNLLKLKRNAQSATTLAMDDFTYHYAPTNNRLIHVNDAVPATNHNQDIDDQISGNYSYDPSGNLIADQAEYIQHIIWNTYGKVQSIQRVNGSGRPNLHFEYGADGQRITKQTTYFPPGVGTADSTVLQFYVRDAQGNVMATYNIRPIANAPLFLSDHTLYGSARLGQRQQNKIVNQNYVPPGTNNLVGVTYVQRGWKAYELSNHLGNVLSVISDRKEAGHCNDTLVAFYYPDIIQNNDYYPFGSPMEGRVQQSKAYRFGFQSQESDDEIYREGKAYAFEYRMHDPRIGRFWSVDPLASKYPWNSPYVFAENQVIAFVELEGLEKATPQQQQNALNAITTFSNDQNTTTVWNNISKQDFVTSLTNMVNNPTSIDQSNTNLCGIATSCKASAEYNPEEFVKMALSVYQSGKYSNGDVTYEANKDILGNSSSNGLGAAEFVVMTTLRHSLNGILSYDPTNDNGTSGFTWPGDVDNILLKGMSMKKTTNTDWTSTPSSGNALATGIIQAVNAGHIVILTVNTSHFMGKSSFSVIPDHYIQVTGITKNPDGTINVGWWSWGQNQTPVKMTKEQLYNATYYYGSFE